MRVLTLLSVLLSLLPGSSSQAQTTQSVTLAWNTDTDPTVVGYNLWYGTSSETYTMNLPDPAKQHPADSVQPASRSGSAGKLLPGLAAQIRDPDTGEVASLYEPGMLWLKGMTLFDSVGNNSENRSQFACDGWIKTGKIAHFDEDGFLFLKAEVSRVARPAFSFNLSSVSNL